MGRVDNVRVVRRKLGVVGRDEMRMMLRLERVFRARKKLGEREIYIVFGKCLCRFAIST